ncbi:flagellar hook protein FlgE [Campylobacter jejuni]|nr:flagellar hook protein FlgE [Campylobacter jejuni]ECQ6818737.1 flagellar hook protein FlgE [Campylobacter jejuni]
MMRSLWSGVSGLQAHQVAMDVEGNNISNVNTTGFKYSRADFGTMFSQTVKIATAPTDGRGGSNPLQIGLGVSVSSTTRIHSQGSVQTTDKNTDVAINGDGFFMVSDDGGLTNYLTRSGDFKLDAYGNFVNNAGFVVQGWNINWDTQSIDSSRTPQNIFIDPGMHIPAAQSTEVAIKANLNSGLNIGTAKTPIYGLDSVHGYNKKDGTAKNENDTGITQFYTTSKNSIEVTEKGVDAGSLFNANGQGLNLRDGQGIWVSYADSKFSTAGTNADPTQGNNGVFDPNRVVDQNRVIFWGHEQKPVTLDITINGVHIQNTSIKSLDEAIAYINTFTAPTDTRDGTGVRAVKKADGSGIDFINTNADGTTDNMKNIDLQVNPDNSAGELVRVRVHQVNGQNEFDWQRTNLRPAGNPMVNGAGSAWIDGNFANNQDRIQIVTAHKYVYSSTPVQLDPMYNPDGGPVFNPANQGIAGTAENNYMNAIQGSLLNTTPRTFRTTEDLRELLQRDARYGVDYDGSGGFEITGEDVNEGVKVTVGATGEFIISNPNEIPARPGVTPPGVQDNRKPHNISFNVTAYTDTQGKISKNDAFTTIFKGFDGVLTVGNSNRQSEQLFLSAFSAGLEIYDSLGSKHTLEVQFVKQSTTQDGGNEWQMIIRVPEPAEINTTGEGPNNIIVGTARFNNDGSLSNYTPKTINFSPNNGAAPNQQIKLSFGTSGSNDGLVSSNSASTLTGQATDGYTSGNLKPDAIRVDDKGNILGEFTNGKTFAVAKIAMASVANNSGLEEIGGNLFKVTANSGNIVVGEAGTGGRGEMKTSALEMSNVDLSRSLTELIIIQRGYQANSKTISTSDQMLQTLIQLKQ